MTDVWFYAVIATVGGVLAAVWAVVSMGSEKDAEPVSLPDAEERLAGLIDLLRDLQQQKSRLDSEAYAAEKLRIEEEAAAALRQRDTLLEAKRATDIPASEMSPFTRYPQLRGAAWGLGAAALSVFLLAPLTQQGVAAAGAGARGPQRGGMGAGAGTNPGTPDSPHGPDSELGMAMERLAANPNDLQAILLIGHRFLQAGLTNEAKGFTERALAIDPKSPEALVHMASLQSKEGDGEAALATLDAVLTAHPGTLEGWLTLGMVAMNEGDIEKAYAAFDKFVEIAPEGQTKEEVRRILQAKRAEATAP